MCHSSSSSCASNVHPPEVGTEIVIAAVTVSTDVRDRHEGEHGEDDDQLRALKLSIGLHYTTHGASVIALPSPFKSQQFVISGSGPIWLPTGSRLGFGKLQTYQHVVQRT